MRKTRRKYTGFSAITPFITVIIIKCNSTCVSLSLKALIAAAPVHRQSSLSNNDVVSSLVCLSLACWSPILAC
ncbi:hypothetical protein HN873_047071 [Arachis hypogaea]